MNKLLLIAVSLGMWFSATPAFAALKLTTILTKVALHNGGNNGFIVKRTVTLKEENVVANEVWTISNADLMKLDASGTNPDGSKWSFEILYKDGKRTTNTTEGNAKSFPYSPEFFEPLLHYRSTKALLSKFISLQVVPPTAANPATNSDTFMSLDRYKGEVVYLFGASETKNTQAPPQLWMQHDGLFLIKKVRMGSQVEVEFENYKEFAEGKIAQPETQTVFWKNANVIVQNTSTDMVALPKLANSYKLQKGDQARLPENASLKEFYSRFR